MREGEGDVGDFPCLHEAIVPQREFMENAADNGRVDTELLVVVLCNGLVQPAEDEQGTASRNRQVLVSAVSKARRCLGYTLRQARDSFPPSVGLARSGRCLG